MSGLRAPLLSSATVQHDGRIQVWALQCKTKMIIIIITIIVVIVIGKSILLWQSSGLDVLYDERKALVGLSQV